MQIDELYNLYNLIERHRKLYYEQDAPEISDSEYDNLVIKLKELEKKYPDSARKNFWDKVGGKTNELFAKVEHKTPMLSLDNVFNFDELKNFFNRVNVDNDFICEMKIDGLAVSLIYEDGIFIRGATRGDGHTGEDVTENLKMIKSLPLKIENKNFPRGIVEVRGEVLMNTKNFNELNKIRALNKQTLFANPRNAAAGTLRQLNKNIVAERNLDILIYYLVDAEKFGLNTQNDVLSWLNNFKFPVQSAFKYCKNLNDVENFIIQWQDEKNNLNYMTDGVVIKFNNISQWNNIGSTVHHPKWAVAYKYKSERVKTKLISVEFSVGRTGTITPVAILEPVQISGTVVQRASLHNAEYLAKIRIGDIVTVEKAGEIIPQIVDDDNIMKIPVKCPVCNSEVIKIPGESAYKCSNKFCPAILKESLKYFASRKCMDIKGLGNRLAAQLTESGKIKKLSDLYNLTLFDLTSLEKTGVKTAQKILNEIEKSKTRPLYALVAGLGINYIGIQTAELLMKNFKSLDELANADEKNLLKVKGIGKIAARSIHEFFNDQDNMKLIEDFKLIGFSENANNNNEAGILSGKLFVFTGKLNLMTREQAWEKVINLGGKISSSVSSKTDFLVVGGKAGAKLNKARELNIKIISEQEFINLIGGK